MINIVTNYTLGLSGTMKRKDGLTKVFEYFIGPVVHKEKTDVTTEVLVKSLFVDFNNFDNVKTDFRGNPLYSLMINVLDSKERNDFLVNVIRNELNKNPKQQIMILSNTKNLLHQLYEGIQLFEESIGYYLGGMKEEKLKESESKKIILATYAMASEGLDIKTLTTLVMATPKSDVCQSVGRILRSKHKTPMVIDIVDNHTLFQNQYKTNPNDSIENNKMSIVQNSICIPRIDSSIPKSLIINTFEKLGIGRLEGVVEIPFKDSNKYKRIIVKIEWNESERSKYILSRFEEGKNVKVVYNLPNPWFWICVPNRLHCR
jgi:superfamily II DNA or RNA helicase